MKLMTLVQAALDQLFPSECLVCGQEGEWLCELCVAKAIFINSSTCPFCDRLSPLGKTCLGCKANYRLAGCRSVWYYEAPIATLVCALKYQRLTDTVAWIEPFLVKLFRELPLPKTKQIIITSVPLTAARQGDRGYNQSEILAQRVAKASGVPYQRLLKRRAMTTSQTKLSRPERFANTEQQFSLWARHEIRDCCVVIVDDVITTGATLSSCAAVLKQAEVYQVWALTIAKD